MNHPEITLILARAANGVIGADGKMPWHLPADLRRFKQLTMGRPMIMGRKTFDSLPAVLIGRMKAPNPSQASRTPSNWPMRRMSW